MTLLFLYVALALVVSFLCSVLEAVLLSVTPSYVEALEQKRPRVGHMLGAFKADIDRPLAAILSLNTIAHTAGAAGAGAQALEVFGSAYVAAVSVLLTLAILVFSEIIPKTLGAVYWKALAPWVARILRPLIWLTYPLVLISQGLRSLLRPQRAEPAVSREEFHAMADIVAREGIVDEQESKVLRNLLRFHTLRARDIMTPRTVLVAFDEDTTITEAAEQEDKLRFSRLLVYQGSLDEISGYVLKHDMLLRLADGRSDLRLGDIKRELIMMSEEARVTDLFDRMVRSKEHMILLVEDMGGVAGVATMEDVVETLLGLEIVDEIDLVEDMQALARRKWAERARSLGLLVDEDGRPESGSHEVSTAEWPTSER